MTPDEQNMVRGLQAKDAESFARLYAEHGTRLYRFCRHLCGNDTDGEDLTQEVFVAAYQAVSSKGDQRISLDLIKRTGVTKQGGIVNGGGSRRGY